SFDVTLFRHDYDKLFSQEGTPPTLVPGPPSYLSIEAVQANLLEGESHGGTFVATWQPLDRVRLQFQYSHLDLDLGVKPGGTDQGQVRVGGNSPENQLGLYTSVALPHDLSLYVAMRHVDDLPNQGVPSYDAVDLSLGWQPN